MTFLKSNELELINGGYLVATKTKNAVYNTEFVELQEQAHYFITLASKVKDVDFVGKEKQSFAFIAAQTKRELSEEKIEVYVKTVKEPETKLMVQLAEEAQLFHIYGLDTVKNENVNVMMQKFNLLKEFETFGLYFEESEIVKLNKIYTIDEILEAVTLLEPHYTN